MGFKFNPLTGELNVVDASGGGGTVTSVSASSPLASSGGATPNITIQVASGSQPGSLSSTDWTTFNNKQNAVTWNKEQHTFATSETTFSLAHTIVSNSLDVVVNGVYQTETADYTLSIALGVTVVTWAGTLASTLVNGDHIDFKYQY